VNPGPLYNSVNVCVASSVGQGVSRSDTCSLMCTGGPASIPGADKFDSGFNSCRVGKMRNNLYVAERPLQKTEGLKCAALSWSSVDYAACGAN